MADKIDLKKQYPDYYQATTEVAEVKLGAGNFVTFDGHGEPGGAAFQNAIGTLYAVAYTIKQSAKERDADFVVAPPEAQFWVEDRSGKPLPMADWRWRILLRLPTGINRAHVERAKDRVGAKRGDLPAQKVAYERIHEGRAIQILHVGPYNTEDSDIQRLQEYAREHGLKLNGPHHEVYLSDPGRTAPERLRTILRAPIA